MLFHVYSVPDSSSDTFNLSTLICGQDKQRAKCCTVISCWHQNWSPGPCVRASAHIYPPFYLRTVEWVVCAPKFTHLSDFSSSTPMPIFSAESVLCKRGNGRSSPINVPSIPLTVGNSFVHGTQDPPTPPSHLHQLPSRYTGSRTHCPQPPKSISTTLQGESMSCQD